MLRAYENDEIAGLPFGLAFAVHNWGKDSIWGEKRYGREALCEIS